jgi:hypothetical protein
LANCTFPAPTLSPALGTYWSQSDTCAGFTSLHDMSGRRGWEGPNGHPGLDVSPIHQFDGETLISLGDGRFGRRHYLRSEAPDGRPRKQAFGPWIRGAFRLLAGMKCLRGTALDPFGHTQERRLERQLALDYEALVLEELLPALRPDNLALALRLAEVVQQVRGFGPVKLANLVTARAQWQALLDAWHGRSPEPVPAKTPQARRVIPVRAG